LGWRHSFGLTGYGYVSSTIVNGYITIDSDVDSTAVLTGFTIQNSSALGLDCNGGDPTISHLRVKGHTGCGMRFTNADVSLSHVVVTGNSNNSSGGGILITSSELALLDVTVKRNRSTGGSGGGLHINASSTVTIDSSTISNNYANSTGGGIYANSSTVTISNSTVFRDTSDNSNGGGIYISGSATLRLHNVQVDSNEAFYYGGGLYMDVDTLIATNTTFNHNSLTNSSSRGGGIYITGGGFNTFDQCRIQYNTAFQHGGGVYINTVAPVFTNVMITDNVLVGTSTDRYGGGIYDASGSSYTPEFTNVTIANNAAYYGGGYYGSSGNGQFTNCIIYHNTATSNPSLNGAGSVTYSDIEGGFTGTGNIDTDPLFVDTLTADYHLTWGSPCIDTGDPDLDGDGNTWESDPDDQDPDGTRMDMGALYYFQESAPLVSIASSETSPTNVSPIPITVTFSEDVTGFEQSDVILGNSSIGNFSGSGSNYSFDITPVGDGAVTVDIPEDVAQDSASYGNSAADQFEIIYDSNMFTDSFEDLNDWVNTTDSGIPGDEWYIDSNGYIGNCARSDVGGYGYGDQLTQSFTFNSEVVVRLWVKKQAGDAVRIYFKVNGMESWVFGKVGDPGSTWVQKEITIPAGTHTINIETDFAGFAWVDELEIQTNFSPVATISSSFTSPTNLSPIPVAVAFSNDVIGFVQSDVSVSNGSIGNFSGSGSNYSFDITPSSDGTITVDIPEDVAQDDQGNGNLAATFSSPSAVVSSEESSPTHNSPFAVEIVFSEPVLDFDQEDLEIVNGSVNTFSGADSLYNIDVTPAADGTVSISLDENMAYDPAGNGNLATNTLEIYYDNLPPIVDVTDIGEAGTLDTLTIEWQSSDVSTIEKHTIYVTNDGQNYSLLDSTSGDVFTYDWVVPNALSDQNRIAVEASDEWGLVAADTTVVFAIVDNDPPVVSIIEPNAGYSIPEYDLLTVRWEAEDNIGIDSVKVLYSNDGGVEYVLMGSLTDPAIDSLTFAVPFGVTDSARVNIIALDAYGNSGLDTSPDFTVTDNTPPEVELLSPQSGAEIEIASIEELTWDGTDNVGIIAVDLHYSIDGGLSWSAIVEGEENTGLYSWTVPNAPSNEVVLRLIGHDAVGLFDTSDVAGISIIIVYPIVTAINPQPGLLTWRESQFSVAFSQSMSSIENESILISSGYSGSVIDSAVVTHADESNTLTIEFPSGFASLDTVTITLQSSSISNIYDYGLDGDGDGEPGDDYTVQYTTAMLADYDNSDTLDVLDLAQFVQALEEDNYYYELGPVSGEVPHFISSLDFTYDIEDVMAFVMMWNWYYTTFGGQFLSYESMGDQLSIETSPDSLIVTIPEGTVAYQVFVKYYPQNVQFSAPEQKSDLQMVHTHEEGVFSLAAVASGNKVSIPLDICGKRARMTVTLVAIGYDNEVLSRSTKEVVIDNIPEAYALGQNYPNPFNPVTVIEYELPDDAHINLAIYDVLGRKIRTLVSGMQPAGYAEVRWNGTDDWGNKVGTGIYFYRIETGKFSKTHKMVLMK